MNSMKVDQILTKANSYTQKGNFNDAEILYHSVLKKFPYNLRASEALKKLNIVIVSSYEENLITLYNGGNLTEVINQCKYLTNKFQNIFVFWKFSGMANFDKQQFIEAELSFRNALKINENDIDCTANLAIIYTNLGALDSAISMYIKAISLNKNFPELYNNLANVYKDKGELEKAIEAYKKAIEINPEYFVAFYNLGIIYQSLKQIEDAIKMYKMSLSIDPNHVQTLNNLGNIYQEQGLIGKAIENFHKVITLDPNFQQAYFNLGNALKGIIFQNPNPQLQISILNLLKKETYVNPSNIVKASLSLLKKDESLKLIFEETQKHITSKNVKNIIKTLAKNSLFLKLLSVSLIQDTYIENSLKNIRMSILDNIFKIGSEAEITNFQAALASQCFLNEYLYNFNLNEINNLNYLEKTIEHSIIKRKKINVNYILCLASYKPLTSFDWHTLINFPKDLISTEKLLLKDQIREKKLKSQIPNLSKINNKVSKEVQEQYEQNPYPRWFTMNLGYKKNNISERMEILNLRYDKNIIPNNKNPEILVAGCGTGEHSIGVASTFKNSKILAIDLSVSSIAYAKRKSEELGVNNIDYMQADILDLLTLNKKFDLVESAGVLHHMNDPIKGWKILVDCLKPGGMMKIGLYSKIAREHITRIRKEIKELNLGNDEITIRDFRSKIIESVSSHHKTITESPDFYSLSNVRDLLFHVQEHQFTLPQIKQFINTSGLKFCGFEVKHAIDKFQNLHKDPLSLYDLDKWEIFENNNKEIFAVMYQFWCQKTA